MFAAIAHDHVVVYCKSFESLKLGRFPRTEAQNEKFKNPDNDPRGPWKAENLSAGKYYAAGQFTIITPAGKEAQPPPGRFWRCNEDTYKKWENDGRIWFGANGMGRPMLKKYRSEVQEGLTPDTWWSHKEFGSNKQASTELKKLFDNNQTFDTPKPVLLLKRLLDLSDDSNALVIDFFFFLSTLAHATIQANSEDSGHRRFIMVQLPEICEEQTSAFKSGYNTIAEIGKERIRRAGNMIKEDNPIITQQLDIGFRVLKLDTSNLKDVYYTPDQTKQTNLELFADHIKEDRRPEDLLFQVLLDWGLDLSLPIAKETIEGKTVFFVDGNVLAACFDTGITEDMVKVLAKRKPLRAVFRDDGFDSDSVKINVEQVFKLLSPDTEVKTI